MMTFELAFVVMLAIAVAGLAVAYFVYVHQHFGYILSPFNISIFIAFFTLALAPHFWSSDASWHALGVYSAESMRPYLLDSLAVNLGGMTIFIATLLYTTQRERSRKTGAGSPFMEKTVSAITFPCVRYVLGIAIAFFTLICLIYNGGTFPLLNGVRDFYYETSISPIYLACTQIITVFGLCCGLVAVRTNKGWLLFAGAFGAALLTGNRSPALLGILLPILVYAIILPGGRRILKRIARTGMFRLLMVLVAVLILGLGLQAVRSGKAIDIEGIANEMLDGNSFSDVRDGAFLLQRFDAVYEGEPIGGNTYLSGVLSFIPSSLSEFREEWAWGRFTIQKLAQWPGTHFGLRGGSFMEAYLNFGLLGIVAVGVLQGMVFHKLDECMRRYLLSNDGVQAAPIVVLIVPFFGSVYDALVCTAGAYNVYVYIALLVLLQVLSLPWAIKERKRLESNCVNHMSSPLLRSGSDV